jgi:hypothetical protein
MNGNSHPDLVGHDCPLGVYPSVVVPVLSIEHGLAVAYWSESNVSSELVTIDKDSTFEKHSDETRRVLRDFDHRRHGLFAFSTADIRIYDLATRGVFFGRLLRASEASRIDPFYRFSLARATGDGDLVRRAFFECATLMRKDCPEFADSWMTENSSPLDREIVPYDFYISPSNRLAVQNVSISIQGLAANFRPDITRIKWRWPGRGDLAAESAVMGLLDQVYGFKHNLHRRDLRRSWDWIYRGQILVFSVVQWRRNPLRTDFSLPAIATQLGLEDDELRDAIDRRYPRSLLWTLLLISQLHRFERLESFTYRNLIERSSGILEAIRGADSESFGLIRKRVSLARDISARPETAVMGRVLLGMAES